MEVVEILTGGIEVISRISAEWTELCDEDPSNVPFFRPEWFAAFVRNFENKINLVTVRLDGKLRAVLPLARKNGVLHGIPVRKLRAVFNLNTQRFDLIHGADEAERQSVAEAVWAAIKKSGSWDIVEIRMVEKDSWLGDVLALAEKENYSTGVWEMDGAPFIDLPQSDDKQRSIDDFFKGSRKHLGRELDRRLTRLRELGNVEFVVTDGYSPELTKTYFELEAKGWKGRGGTAVSDNPLVAQMHEEFANAIAQKQSLLNYELKLDGKTIAMSLNIRSTKKTIHWKTSYDEEYARYSPGNLLFRELLNDCIRNSSPEIDFLSPATPNKRSWASGEREHVSFYIFRRDLIGSALRYWKFGVIGGLRHLKAHKPSTMRPVQVSR